MRSKVTNAEPWVKWNKYFEEQSFLGEHVSDLFITYCLANKIGLDVSV